MNGLIENIIWYVYMEVNFGDHNDIQETDEEEKGKSLAITEVVSGLAGEVFDTLGDVLLNNEATLQDVAYGIGFKFPYLYFQDHVDV